MMGAAPVLGAWLAPAGWLAVSSLLLTDAPAGLWVGLLLVLGPLAALSIRPDGRGRGQDDEPSVFARSVGMAVHGMLLCANLALAGDIASALGGPRWHGIALAVGGSLLVTAWPRAHRVRAVLVVLSVGGLAVSLLALALASGFGPLDAWEAVAGRGALRFGADSESVAEGRVVGPFRQPILFEEEHRVTAPDGGAIRLVTRDGDKTVQRSLTLGAGQVLTLRPGDALLAEAPVRLRFEARRRVPGTPPSGVAWADGQRGGWAGSLGLAVTLLGGAIGLLAAGDGPRLARRGMTVVGGGLLAALLWAEGWAVYSLLLAPEVFVGGLTPARLVEVPLLALGRSPAARLAQIALIVAVFVGVVAAARGWLDLGGAPHRAGGSEGARHMSLRGLVIVIAGLASLWPAEPWPLMLLALGAGASALGPAALSAAPAGRAVVVAGALGLLVFAAVGVAAWLYPPRGEALAAVGRFPALAALPVGLVALPLARRITG